MKTIIIGAQLPEGTLMNKYRHNMLGRALERCEFQGTTEGVGFSGGFKEQIWVYQTEYLNSEEWDMLGTLALAYDQEYFLYIENDVCYQIDPLTLHRTRLGIWWGVHQGTPEPVLLSICGGLAGRPDGCYSFYNDSYYGLHTDADMGCTYAEDLGLETAAGPYMTLDSRLERAAHEARTYPY